MHGCSLRKSLFVVCLLNCGVAAVAFADDAPVPSKQGKSPPKIAARPSTRDPAPVVEMIDREWRQALEAAGVPTSEPADDAEFLRRVCLDLTGCIPTYERTTGFLDSSDPDKRRGLIDELLASREFATHFGRWWRNLIQPRDTSSAKQQVDRLTPWLADQFQANRPWSETVTTLLTADANMSRDPQAAFYLANSEELMPRPQLLATSAGKLFLGLQIGCAECHDHPFAEWKQDDFWGLAAFFSRVHKRSKSDFTLIEDPPDAVPVSIVVPDGSGKAAGRAIAAKYLKGELPAAGETPLRPLLAEWLTSRDNPWFATAMVNRLWGQLFGRGLVRPVDDLRPENAPTHPAMLRALSTEFAESDFDVQHLVRCLCLSQAYQMTSRTRAENRTDTRLCSHMLVKVLTPDMLYDSLLEALNARPSFRPVKGGKKGGRPIVVDLGPRDAWLRTFGRSGDGAPADEFTYGIPEMLRLLNAPELTARSPLIADLLARGDDPEQIIEALYLVALSRWPSDTEQQRMVELVSSHTSPEEGYAGVLWVLLNSGEFVLNH